MVSTNINELIAEELNNNSRWPKWIQMTSNGPLKKLINYTDTQEFKDERKSYIHISHD